MTPRPSGRERSIVRLRLPRLSDWKYLPSFGTTAALLRRASPSSGSTFTTSAPKSESAIPAKGPATICENSSTRTPARGPAVISSSRETQAASGDDVPLDFRGAAADGRGDHPDIE